MCEHCNKQDWTKVKIIDRKPYYLCDECYDDSNPGMGSYGCEKIEIFEERVIKDES